MVTATQICQGGLNERKDKVEFFSNNPFSKHEWTQRTFGIEDNGEDKTNE